MKNRLRVSTFHWVFGFGLGFGLILFLLLFFYSLTPTLSFTSRNASFVNFPPLLRQNNKRSKSSFEKKEIVGRLAYKKVRNLYCLTHQRQRHLYAGGIPCGGFSIGVQPSEGS